MKRLPVILFVVLAALAFAGGQKEQTAINLVLLSTSITEDITGAVSRFKVENPNISVEIK